MRLSLLFISFLAISPAISQDSTEIANIHKIHDRILNYTPKTIRLKEVSDSTKSYFYISKKDSTLFRIDHFQNDTLYQYYQIEQELVLMMVTFRSPKKKPIAWWYYYDKGKLVGIRHPTALKDVKYIEGLKARYYALLKSNIISNLY